MLNPNFIIFIQLNHYCLTSEIIIFPVYGCELYTIPDYSNMYTGWNFVDYILFVCLMVFNATINNNSVISWRSGLLVEDTRGPGETQLDCKL
jgi:hypothetical protein